MTPFWSGKTKVKVIRPRNAVTERRPMGRPTNFKLGERIEYDDLHHRRAMSKVKFIT